MLSEKMKLERLERSACFAVGQQTFKVAVTTCAVVILLLINNNINQLVACLSQQPLVVATPISHAESCQNKTLTSRSNTVTTSLVCCQRQYVSVIENGHVLVEYNKDQAGKFLNWLDQCYNKECLLHENSRETCKYMSNHRKNMLCYDENEELDYIVINGHNMHDIISQSVFDFFVTMC